MTLCIQKTPSLIILLARANGPGCKGDLIVEVKPGEEALGRTFDEWQAEKASSVEID
jgi:hypothetical protein